MGIPTMLVKQLVTGGLFRRTMAATARSQGMVIQVVNGVIDSWLMVHWGD